MKKFVVASLLAMTVAAPAFAADVSYRVEAHGGWDRVSVASGNDEGFAYGLGAGVDYAVNPKLFVGLEANVDDSTQKDCMTDVITFGDRLCAGSGRDLSLVGRIGTVLSDGYKLYALAGYTNARLKLSYDDGVTSASTGTNLDGFRLGAGVQLPFVGQSYSKVEYRYSNYESDFSRHQVLVGVGLNF